MTPDVYSPVLGAALAVLVGTLVCCVSARVSRSRHLLLLGQVGAAVTFIALSIAVISHVKLGHTPGTETALGPAGFIAEHPLVAAVTVAAAVLFGWARRRSHSRAS